MFNGEIVERVEDHARVDNVKHAARWLRGLLGHDLDMGFRASMVRELSKSSGFSLTTIEATVGQLVDYGEITIAKDPDDPLELRWVLTNLWRFDPKRGGREKYNLVAHAEKLYHEYYKRLESRAHMTKYELKAYKKYLKECPERNLKPWKL